MTLRVGHITFANCVPFFHYLSESGFTGEIVPGVPAELNRRLAAGELDVCPSSSIEYARHASDYLLLPGHSISSIGPVESVLLFTDRGMNQLDGVPIAITGESATSVALLRLLLMEFMQLREVDCRVPERAVEEIACAGGPALLIGDRALRTRLNIDPEQVMVVDLGELWYHYTGLPFVFALWMVRRDAARRSGGRINDFQGQLATARQKAFSDLATVAGACGDRFGMQGEELVRYWQLVSYDLDPMHLEGLNCFYTLLHEHRLIDSVPELEFFSWTQS